MLFDWFTIGAQLINFLVLVWLLKRFLYKPILEAIDSREKRIAAELADAQTRKAEASKEREEFERKNLDFNRRRADLESQLSQQVSSERARLLDEARSDANDLSVRRRESLEKEARNLQQLVGRRVQQEVFAIARKALTDLAGDSLELRLVQVFCRRLAELDVTVKATVAAVLKSTDDRVIVRTAFELPPEERAVVKKMLDEAFAADVPARFEVATDLISGIELTVDGRRVAWSVADYLVSLEKTVGSVLREHVLPEAPST